MTSRAKRSRPAARADRAVATSLVIAPERPTIPTAIPSVMPGRVAEEPSARAKVRDRESTGIAPVTAPLASPAMAWRESEEHDGNRPTLPFAISPPPEARPTLVDGPLAHAPSEKSSAALWFALGILLGHRMAAHERARSSQIGSPTG